ncbi:MAG TPA: hypothetical protein VMR33_12785 [Candidatus Baltobacteraceae bacterium]|jgi:hypothetical protein|nr:hypothetical protein [Candidatus Baltobacteraceae bacterium]
MSTTWEERQNYVLVCVQKPATDGVFPAIAPWLTLYSELEKTPSLTATSERLCENEWLFPERDGAITAMRFLVYCRATGLVCKAYRLRGKPEPWV